MQQGEFKGTALRRQRIRKLAAIFFITVAVIGIIVAAGSWAIRSRAAKDFPPRNSAVVLSLPASVSYPVYAPTSNTVVVDTATAEVSDSNYTYIIRNNDRQLMVVQQPKPTLFDFDSFNSKTLNAKQLVSPIGSAYIGSFNNRLMVSIVTGQTWLTMTSSDYFSTEELSEMLASLKKLQ